MVDDQKINQLTDHEKNVVAFIRKGEPITGKRITQNAVTTYVESRMKHKLVCN